MSTRKTSRPAVHVPTPANHVRVTVTNEVELERARLLSVDEGGGGDLLSLANRQARALEAPIPIASSAPQDVGSQPPPSRPSRPVQGALEVMRSRVQLDDFTGALELARAILRRDEANGEAMDVVRSCESRLETMYRARIGPLDRSPTVVISNEQIRWLTIDHRAGFLLSMMDGVVTFENLLDLSGMQRIDALQLLAELIENEVITVA